MHVKLRRRTASGVPSTGNRWMTVANAEADELRAAGFRCGWHWRCRSPRSVRRWRWPATVRAPSAPSASRFRWCSSSGWSGVAGRLQLRTADPPPQPCRIGLRPGRGDGRSASRVLLRVRDAGRPLGFSIGTLALTAAFANSLLAEAQKGVAHPFQLPWLVPVLITAAASFVLDRSRGATTGQGAAGDRGPGIVAMVVLAAVIFARGGAPATGMDFSFFSLSGGSVSAVPRRGGGGVPVLGRFRGVRVDGEETADAEHNIPVH